MLKQQLQFALRDEDELSLDLIEAQYTLKNSRDQNNGKSLVILVSGIEFAGKGEAVKQLREWVDPRYLHVKADIPRLFTDQQTFWQPYARFTPAEGQIQVMFGNWYSDLLTTAMHVSKPLDETMFDRYIESMRSYEQDLKNNRVDVIKVWFDLPWKVLQKRLDNMDISEQRWHKLHGLDWRSKKEYDTVQRLRQKFTDDWLVIEGENAKVRDQQFAQYILHALKNLPKHKTTVRTKWKQAAIPQALLHPPTEVMDKSSYKTELKKLTQKVSDALRSDSRNVIISFEGVDASGKGGAIKRIVKKLDPREYQIHTIAAPEKYELRRPYLWRFWSKLTEMHEITIFDRTWYGRVLVERVEGFAQPIEWQRAYEEINRFEKDLVDNQTLLIKFWLAISKDEQQLRFKAREAAPHKRFKITADDWRNREHWDDYLNAAADMLARTDTKEAPWHLIATDNKYSARIQVLQAILKQLNAE